MIEYVVLICVLNDNLVCGQTVQAIRQDVCTLSIVSLTAALIRLLPECREEMKNVNNKKM